MQNKPTNKKSSTNVCKDIIEILGTRYYRIAVLRTSNAEPECVLSAFVSTPLAPTEVKQFIVNRIGKDDFQTIATQITRCEAERGDEKAGILGLVSFEALLKPYVPEVITEVTYAKIVKTTKGTEIQMPIDPETGEVIEKKVGK